MNRKGFTPIIILLAAVIILVVSFCFLLYITNKIPRHPGYIALPIAPSPSSTIRSINAQLPFNTYTDKNYGFQITIPQNWTVSLGNPPDISRPAFGPTKNFRPLIFLRVVASTNLDQEKTLMLADESILKTQQQTISGVTAQKITYTTFKGLPETSLFFTHNNFGFIFTGTEGTETENSIAVFDAMVPTFKFIK